MLKIKQVASKCKKRGIIYLIDQISGIDEETGEVLEDVKRSQWVSDGKCFYPLNNIPYLKIENLVNIFEIKEKQLEKIATEKMRTYDFNGLNFEDVDITEQPIKEEDIKIELNGVTYMAFNTSRGIIYIDSSALAPLANMFDLLQLYERVNKQNGKIYVACKTGFLIQAIITPEHIITPKFAEDLSKLSEMTNKGVEYKR